MALEFSANEDAQPLQLRPFPFGSKRTGLPYEYSQLSESHIRIISIQAATSGTPLTLSINQVPLTNPGSYTALSYAWEGQPADIGVDVGGKTFNISHNVHNALLALRSEESNVRVWVDAICINQADLQERGSQVQIMGIIYKGAEIVTVWLGDADEYTVSTIEVIKKLVNLTRRFRKEPVPVTFDFSTVLDRNLASQLNDFFERPWFSRVWTYQEYIFGKDVVLRVGTFIMRRATLYDAAKWARRHDKGWYLSHGYNNFGLLDQERNEYIKLARRSTTGAHFQLENLLRRTQQRFVSDPRDKIFGVLPLATESYGIVPDYTKSKVEIFTHVAKSLLEGSRNLRILGLATGTLDCPSWVPDWSYKSSLKPLHSFLSTERPFDASYGTKREFSISDISPSKIQLQGKVLDKIDQTYEYTQLVRTTLAKHGEHLLDGLLGEVIVAFPHDGEVYPFTGEARQAIFLKTLMVDLSLESARINDYFRRYYYAAGLRKKDMEAPSSKVETQAEREVLLFILSYSRYRAMFSTTNGYIGILPAAARTGDLMCILLGGETPYILRPGGQAGEYMFIGECYAHGLMDGEALRGVDMETEVFDTFKLI